MCRQFFPVIELELDFLIGMATVKGQGRRLDAHPADHFHNRLAYAEPGPRTYFDDVLIKAGKTPHSVHTRDRIFIGNQISEKITLCLLQIPSPAETLKFPLTTGYHRLAAYPNSLSKTIPNEVFGRDNHAKTL